MVRAKKNGLNSAYEMCVDRSLLGGALKGIEAFTYRSIERAIAPLPACVHEDCVEILVYQKGIQMLTIEKREFAVTGGDIVIIPAGHEHSTGQQPQYSACYHRILVNCSENVPLLGLDGDFRERLRGSVCSLRAYRYRETAALPELVSTAFQHALSARPCVQTQACGEIICFLTALETVLGVEPLARTPAIESVFRYINEHITEELRLRDLAELSGASLSYFKESFLKQVGVTPMYYINWRKMAYAKRMLVQGYSVTDISMVLNFNTSAYFSTVFKNYTSRTPMQYKSFVDREMQKQRHITDKERLG